MEASFIDGRIQIRDEALIRRSLAYDIPDALLKNKGITRVSVNRRVGSITGAFRQVDRVPGRADYIQE